MHKTLVRRKGNCLIVSPFSLENSLKMYFKKLGFTFSLLLNPNSFHKNSLTTGPSAQTLSMSHYCQVLSHSFHSVELVYQCNKHVFRATPVQYAQIYMVGGGVKKKADCLTDSR